jgi:hypothetical protein
MLATSSFVMGRRYRAGAWRTALHVMVPRVENDVMDSRHAWRRRTGSLEPWQQALVFAVVLGVAALVGVILSIDGFLAAVARGDRETSVVALLGIVLGAIALGCLLALVLAVIRPQERTGPVAFDTAMFRVRLEQELQNERDRRTIGAESPARMPKTWATRLEEGRRWYDKLLAAGAHDDARQLLSLLVEVQRLSDDDQHNGVPGAGSASGDPGAASEQSRGSRDMSN